MPKKKRRARQTPKREAQSVMYNDPIDWFLPPAIKALLEHDEDMNTEAAKAANVLLHGMAGPNLEHLESQYSDREAQGRMYLLGALMSRKFTDENLSAGDLMSLVDMWNAPPTEQLPFAAEFAMRSELAAARVEGWAEKTEAAIRAAKEYWA